MNYEVKALAGIRRKSGTEIGEYGVDLFVSHHIEELSSTYWQKHVGAEIPTTEQVISLLVLCSKDEDIRTA